MAVAFTVTEISYLVVILFCNLVLPFSCLCLWYKVFGFTICLVSSIATKMAMISPKSFVIYLEKPIRLSYFQTNVFSVLSFTNCLGYD